ncbi:MAG: hypothetical protein PF448_09415 [Bacteroidales bacterium]|jgi:hypothetical protein|nr:hypothetical protein [Bacteroidales bacterium]
MINIKDIKKDIISFADDEEDVIFETDGTVLFTRQGTVIQFKLKETENGLFVVYNDAEIKYRTFLSKEIARLDIFANKLIEKKDSIDPFIDANATLYSSSKKTEKESLLLIKDECDKSELFFGTKITFVTADAGHGKTVLLKEFQKAQAKRFIDGESNYIFWHIDLQGRDLVRLNEAIMYDLGLLRLSGLYFSSILTLMKHNLIILGIDGFDELAAEIGGENALGSLSNLVLNMEGKGTLIAASRRTFFNTQDYIKRTKILHQKIKQDCGFNELKISNWKRKQNIEYLGYYFDKPENKYLEILSIVKDANHPILERPYLFTKIVEILQQDNISLSDFLDAKSDNFNNINGVIEAFVRREVLKWNYTDKDTGKPYLSFEQHMELLSIIASEMWENQNEIISIDNIQFLLTILFEDWNVDEEIKSIRMVESHALLIPVTNKDNYRKFDHIEFRNFFIAKALVEFVKDAIDKNHINNLKKFLYIAQLPDSIAHYFSNLINGLDKDKIVTVLKEVISGEWKPTYLQPNIGTIIPYLLHNFSPQKVIYFNNKLTFSSLIFENKVLRNINFAECNFVNISFNSSFLQDITFNKSSFNEIRIYYKSDNQFINVHFDNCEINAVILIDDEGEQYPEYTPTNIISTLKQYGFKFDNLEKKSIILDVRNQKFNKTVKRFITKFNKSIYQYEIDIKEESYYSNSKEILTDIIPLLIKHEIISEVETKNTRQVNSKAWRLVYKDIEEIMKAEEDNKSELSKFWKEVNEHK